MNPLGLPYWWSGGLGGGFQMPPDYTWPDNIAWIVGMPSPLGFCASATMTLVPPDEGGCTYGPPSPPTVLGTICETIT